MVKGRKNSAAAGSRATSASALSSKGRKKKDEKEEAEMLKQNPEPNDDKTAQETELVNLETKSVAESDSGKACGDMSGNVEVIEPEDSQDYNEPSLSDIIVAHYDGDRGHGGHYDGYGEAHFVSGNMFKGNFCKGHMHGKGIYTWNNGMSYDGNFTNNRITGYGTYKWPDSSLFEGEVSNGFRHGVGVFRSPRQGVSYSGQWYLGKRHGRGIMHYSEQSWYEGDWVNNARHGFGVRRYRTGNVFEGHWTNDKRHGDGTMRWLATNETYRGTWENGVQHGYGTHTWYLQRVPGSQYPLRNEYVGDFINGLRHGRGKFFYASGAVYDGEWENGKKSGWGKFIFKNGRVFEGQFDNDHMVDYPSFEISGNKTPDLSKIRTRTPVGWEENDVCSDSFEGNAGPGLTLDIDGLLDDHTETDRNEELKQVTHLVLRNISIFRRVYSFYSALGHDRSLDNTFVMTRFQFWRFLKDCKVHHHQTSLSAMDRAIARCHAAEDVHNPMEKILMREFLSSLVILAHLIFKDDPAGAENKTISSSNQRRGGANKKPLLLAQCLQQLIDQHVTKHSCRVKGYFMLEPRRAVTALNYMDKSWQIFLTICTPNPVSPHDLILKMRRFLFILRDLGIIGKRLPASTVLQVLAEDDPAVYDDSSCNLEVEITFLEFFEALIGCALKLEPITSETRKIDEPEAADLRQASRPDSSISDILSHHENLVTSVHSVMSQVDQDRSQVGIVKSQLSSKSQVKAPSHDEMSPQESGVMSKQSLAKASGGGSTGAFLQTLSQMTVKEQDDATTTADEVASQCQDEAAVNEGPVEEHEEDKEYSAWAKKLNIFFSMHLFLAWDKMEALKREVARHRKVQEEKERLSLVQMEAERRLQGFQSQDSAITDEQDLGPEKTDEEENVADEESQVIGALSTTETPPPEIIKSSNSIKGKSGRQGKRKK